MFYYAELNEKDICIGVFESLTALTEPQYIEVDSLNPDFVGMHYLRDESEWETPSFSVLADHSTDEINYRTTDQKLSDVLDGKAAASHTHTGYAQAQHTHFGFAPEEHEHAITDVVGLDTALDGKAEVDHTHDEYLTTEGGSIKLQHMSITRGTNPATAQTISVAFYDKDGTTNATDRLAGMTYQLNPDGTSTLNIMNTDPSSGTVEKLAGIRIQWLADGTPRIALTNHPVTGSNDHSIATTAWVNAAIKKALGA